MATITIALKPSAPINISGTPTGVPAAFFTDPAYVRIGQSGYTVNLSTASPFTVKKLAAYANAGYFTISGGDLITLNAAVPVKTYPSWTSGAVHDSAVKSSSHEPMDAVGQGGTW